MVRIAPSHLWAMRILYILLCMGVIVTHLLPLDTTPRIWAPPDLLLAFTFAWALRRPDYVPILSIAGVFLMADLLFQRPPGLMAGLVVVGTEYLRIRFGALHKSSFVGEWLAVCVVIVAIVVLYRLSLAIVAVNLAPLGPTLIQAVLTILVYPLAVVASQSLLGVRKQALRPSERGAGVRA